MVEDSFLIQDVYRYTSGKDIHRINNKVGGYKLLCCQSELDPSVEESAMEAEQLLRAYVYRRNIERLKCIPVETPRSEWFLERYG